MTSTFTHTFPKANLIKDDPNLEREADVMGLRASRLSQKGAVASNKRVLSNGLDLQNSRCPIQGKFIKGENTEAKPTAARLISELLALPVYSIGLPGVQQKQDLPRAESVEAVISSKTLRDKERESSAKLALVTSMARAEQYLLRGVDIQRFYDAGHLVGDQLVGRNEVTGEDVDSFQIWNLAPQTSAFNQNDYLNMENRIRKVVEQEQNKQITLKVDLTYGEDYDITVKDLIERDIVTAGEYASTGDKVQIYGVKTRKENQLPTKGKLSLPQGKKASLTEHIRVPRRIPRTWKLQATIKDAELPEPSKSHEPTIGQPYSLQVKNEEEAQVLEAKQWVPERGEIKPEDVRSVIAKYFQGDPEDILQKVQQKNPAMEEELMGKDILKSMSPLAEKLEGMHFLNISQRTKNWISTIGDEPTQSPFADSEILLESSFHMPEPQSFSSRHRSPVQPDLLYHFPKNPHIDIRINPNEQFGQWLLWKTPVEIEGILRSEFNRLPGSQGYKKQKR